MPGLIKDQSVGDLNKLLQQAKGPHSRFEPNWHLNLAYYLGEQWIFWNRGRLDRPRLDPQRITITDNRIIGVVRNEVAKMSKQKPAWQVIPVTSDDQDLESSMTGEKILTYFWKHLHMRTRLEDVLLWSRITGAGFWKLTWDSAKGKKFSVVTDAEGSFIEHPETGAPMKPEEAVHPETGQMPEGLKPKTIAQGDLNIEVINPFEVFPDPLCKTIEEAEWLIHVSVKSPEYVKAHYGVELEPDTDIAPGPIEGRLFPAYQITGTSAYKGIKLNEYWSPPNSQHPEGRHVIWAKEKILEEGPNPYGCIPFIMFRGVPVPGRLWPTSVTEQLRGPQIELNKLKSQIIENAQRLGNPALMVSRQSDTNYSGVPGERIDYDDTTQNAQPSYLVPPPMPQYVVQQLDRIESSIQEISGQHEVSNAQVPAGVKAASAINLLQEADDTRLGPAIYDMEEQLAKAGSMLLKLFAQYYTEERTLMIVGEDHRIDALLVKGAALRANTEVEVQAGSAFPRSKAARQAAIQDMLALYFQYQGNAPMDRRQMGKILSDLEAGGLEKLFGDLSVDEGQIQRENQRMVDGEVLPINTYDNHQLHIEGHKEFQKSPLYQYLPEEIKKLFEIHIQMHREQFLRVLGPPMMGQPGLPPGPGGPPGQGGPEGPPPPGGGPGGPEGPPNAGAPGGKQ